MKNIAIICILFFLMISCKSSKQLPAGASQVVNISGQWNNSDARIAAIQFEKKLKTNDWYKALIDKDSIDVHVYIEKVNYSNNIAHPMQTLEKEIGNQLNSISNILVLEGKPDHLEYLILSTSVQANQINSFGEKAIQYNIVFSLSDRQQNILMENKQSIKKYINK